MHVDNQSCELASPDLVMPDIAADNAHDPEGFDPRRVWLKPPLLSSALFRISSP